MIAFSWTALKSAKPFNGSLFRTIHFSKGAMMAWWVFHEMLLTSIISAVMLSGSEWLNSFLYLVWTLKQMALIEYSVMFSVFAENLNSFFLDPLWPNKFSTQIRYDNLLVTYYYRKSGGEKKHFANSLNVCLHLQLENVFIVLQSSAFTWWLWRCNMQFFYFNEGQYNDNFCITHRWIWSTCTSST